MRPPVVPSLRSSVYIDCHLARSAGRALEEMYPRDTEKPRQWEQRDRPPWECDPNRLPTRIHQHAGSKGLYTINKRDHG